MMSSATSKIVESTKNQGIQLNLTNTTNCSSKFVNRLLVSAVLNSVTRNKCFLVQIL